MLVGGRDVVLSVANHDRAGVGREIAGCACDGHGLLLVLAVELGADHSVEVAPQIEGLKEWLGQRTWLGCRDDERQAL